jgi:hypothetical protein
MLRRRGHYWAFKKKKRVRAKLSKIGAKLGLSNTGLLLQSSLHMRNTSIVSVTIMSFSHGHNGYDNTGTL